MRTRSSAGARRPAPARPPGILLLPDDLADSLLALLPNCDQKQLALACRDTAAWLRRHRAAARVPVNSQHELCQALNTLVKAPSLRSVRLVAFGKVPLTLNLRSFSARLPRLCDLVLHDCLITGRTLGHLTALSHLTSLALESCNSEPEGRLNADGCFSALAALPALRAFTASSVQGDAGLQLATQLTSISLKLPDHMPDYEELPPDAALDLICDNCGQVHEEDVDQMMQAYTDWQDTVSIGAHLHGLSSLKRLEVDFCGECMEINTVLNTLDLGQGGCLAGLTSLTLLNTSRKDYRARLMRAFDSLPSLACLECQFEAHAYWMHCPEDSMDAAGRKVALTMLDRRGWLLQRSLPAAEE